MPLPQFHALMRRWSESVKREDYRFGLLAACLTSTKEEPTTPETFFSSLLEPETPATEQARMRAFMAKFGHNQG